MMAEAWNSIVEPEVVAILLCSKCKMHSIYSWEIKNEEVWKQKFFCPHCQLKHFSKVDRGRTLTKSNWGLEVAKDKDDSEKWKVAERLMGTATLLKKEELIDKMLMQHVRSLNASIVERAAPAGQLMDPQVSDIEGYENQRLLSSLLNKATTTSKSYSRSR